MPTKAEIEDLWAVHESEEVNAERAVRAAGLDDTRSWVDPNGYRLSDRLWQQKQDIRAAIDDRLRKAIAKGEDAITVAKDLETYLHPKFAPLRTKDGKIVRKDIADRIGKGVYTMSPRGGAGSFPARRLARTEVTRAHGQATVATAAALGEFVRWVLSGSHPKRDECDTNAKRNVGHGAGVYGPNDVPTYPAHPHCLCTLQPHSLETVDGVVARLREAYGLGES